MKNDESCNYALKVRERMAFILTSRIRDWLKMTFLVFESLENTGIFTIQPKNKKASFLSHLP